MPRPLKTLRVLPNPWTFIHHELGPQGACVVDLAGREDAPLRWVGAQRLSVLVEARESMKIGKVTADDPRGNRAFARFVYTGLKGDLLSGEAIELPNTPYYRQQLEQGALIPADKPTSEAARCAFADLNEAKKAGVAVFEADWGRGEYEKLAAEIVEANTADKPAPVEKKPTTHASGDKPKSGEGSKS